MPINYISSFISPHLPAVSRLLGGASAGQHQNQPLELGPSDQLHQQHQHVHQHEHRILNLRRPSATARCETTAVEKTDVLIVGGGIVGSSLAYHLLRNSDSSNAKKITLIDRGFTGSGCTGLSVGTIFAAFDPFKPNLYTSEQKTRLWRETLS